MEENIETKVEERTEIKNEMETVKITNKQELIIKDLGDQALRMVDGYVKNGQLTLPKNYSVENAMKGAYLKIIQTVDMNKKPALEVCTKESIAQALMQTAIMGLNPSKDQVYYIVYGNKLTAMPSYFGRITALKRIKGINNVNAQVIYEKDEFSYDIRTDGSIYNIRHIQKIENIDESKIIGGYCVITYEDQEYGVVATLNQIQQNWNMSKTNKNKETFKSEYVKRTMVSKSIKWFINTRDDEDLIIETLVDTTKEEFNEKEVVVIKDEKVIDFND